MGLPKLDVGVLVSRRVFGDCLRETSPYESLSLYDHWGKIEGFSPVFFTVDQVRFTDWTVHGIIRDGTGRFQWVRVPLPRLIHNRIKPMIRSTALVRLQQSAGTTLFNRENRLDKWQVDRMLRREPALAPHLPDTSIGTEAELYRLLDRYGSVYIKPRDRSLGLGILRVEKTDRAEKVQVTEAHGKKNGIVPASALHHFFRKKGRQEQTYLIQQAIPLMKLEESPVDFRVAVQRGRSGEWQMTGIVAKKGPSKAIVTNMAAGGSAIGSESVFESMFSDDSLRKRIKGQIGDVAVKAAERLSGQIPGLADLGIDIGVDVSGQIWIIEVNGRDLRITFRQAGEMDIWQNIFRKPMQYASYLLQTKRENGVGGRCFSPLGLCAYRERSAGLWRPRCASSPMLYPQSVRSM